MVQLAFCVDHFASFRSFDQFVTVESATYNQRLTKEAMLKGQMSLELLGSVAPTHNLLLCESHANFSAAGIASSRCNDVVGLD